MTTISGEEALALPPGSVVRWSHDRSDGGLRALVPQRGIPRWVPPISVGSRYELLFRGPELPPGYRPPAPRKSPPCSCDDCEARHPASVVGDHVYALETDDGSDGAWAWRWCCVCTPRARGRWQWQSPGAAFHGWLDHVAREGSTTT